MCNKNNIYVCTGSVLDILTLCFGAPETSLLLITLKGKLLENKRTDVFYFFSAQRSNGVTEGFLSQGGSDESDSSRRFSPPREFCADIFIFHAFLNVSIPFIRLRSASRRNLPFHLKRCRGYILYPQSAAQFKLEQMLLEPQITECTCGPDQGGTDGRDRPS